MSLKNGKLSGIPFKQAKWTGGKITPTVVVLHDTASRLERGSAAAYLRNNDRKVSVHFVVERDGSIEQQVPVGLRANHAGRSVYHGRSGVNAFSIGIEIVNPGRMTRASATTARTWFRQLYHIDEYGIQEVRTDEHGHGLWMDYTEAQIVSVAALLETLFDEVATLNDIVSHWYISPGRKVDTNPLFPLDHIRSRTLGREDPRDDEADVRSVNAHPDEMVRIKVPDDALNLRRWPSFNPNVISKIPNGAVVPLLMVGEFDGRAWAKVIYGGQEGWIVARYATSAIHKDEGEGQ